MVMGKTFEEHLTNLEEVFSRKKKASLKLNSKKCLLFQKEVEFLGNTVSTNGIKTIETKINAIRDWLRPRDKHEVWSFLGLCTYYRRFVNGFAYIALCTGWRIWSLSLIGLLNVKQPLRDWRTHYALVLFCHILDHREYSFWIRTRATSE